MRFKKSLLIFYLILLFVSLFAVEGVAAPILPENRIEVAGISFGPIRAIERKVDELDDIADKHWKGLWNTSGCTSTEDNMTDYNCEHSDPDFPSKVLNYWASNPSDRPDNFAVAVVSGAENSPETPNDTLTTTSYGWRYKTGGAISSVAAVNFKNYIFINSHDGKIYSFLPNGTLRDEFKVSYLENSPENVGAIYASPAIGAHNNLYFGSQSGLFFSINGDTGVLNWMSSNIGDWIYASAAIGPDNTTYIGARNGLVYAFDDSDSTPRWSYNAGAEIISSAAVGAIGGDTIIYFGDRDGYLHAVRDNGASATVMWTYKTGGGIKSSPALDAAGNIYFGSDDGYFYALNPDGSLKWETQVGDAVSSSAALGSDSTVYAGCWDGKLYAFNHQTGDIRWTFTTGARITSSPLVARSGDSETIYFGSADKYLYAVSDSGTGLWKLKAEAEISSSPAFVNKKIIFADNDGYVYGVDSKMQALASSSWPKHRRDATNSGSVLTPEFSPWTGPIWYVNSDSTAGGAITTAGGDDENTGGPEDPFRTVGRALEEASSGETIYIDIGTYNEQVIVDTPGLTFRGVGPDSTIFDFADSSAATGAVAFSSENLNNLSIREIGIQNYHRGISITGATGASIDTVGVQYCSDGIYFSGSQLTARSLLLQNNDSAPLKLDAGNSILDQLTIWNNNAPGIIIENGTGNSLKNSLIENNTDSAIVLTAGSNNRIYSNRITTNGAGIAVNSGNTNNIFQNSFENNSGYQLVLNSLTQDNVIEKNNFESDSAVLDLNTQHSLINNWWNNTDQATISGQLTGSDTFIPYRLGRVDTDPLGDSIAPTTPQITADTPGSYYAILNWQEITTNEDGSAITDFEAYRIYRTTYDTETDWKQNATLAGEITDITTTTFIDTGLRNNGVYHYRITAVDNNTPENESYFSDSTTVTPYHQGPTWYVNDNDADSYFTTAIGNDTNSGGPQDPFRTISRALQSANQGETIQIDIGTYSETVVIDSPDSHNNLTITGYDSSPTGTVLDFGDSSAGATGFDITGIEGITINNLLIREFDRGIKFNNVINSEISNINLEYIWEASIDLSASNNNVIYNNKMNIARNYFHVKLNGSENNQISSNYLYGGRMRFENLSNNNTISSNTLKEPEQSSFSLNNSQNNQFIDNSSINITGNPLAGFRVEDSSSDNYLEGNFIGNSDYGIESKNSKYCTSVNNHFANISNDGIRLQTGSDGWHLEQNLIHSSGQNGIKLMSSKNITLTKNTSRNNGAYQLYIDSGAINPVFGTNNFINADTSTGLVYSEITTDTLSMRYNWWSTADEQIILDNLDGVGSDSVIFKPFRLGIADTYGYVIVPEINGWDPESPSEEDTYASLSWEQSEYDIEGKTLGGDFQEYRIYRTKYDTVTEWKNGTNLIGTTATEDYEDTTVNRSDTYYYRYTAVAVPSQNVYENESWFSKPEKVVMPPATIGITQPDSGLITNADSITVNGTALLAVESDSMQIFVNNILQDSFVVGVPRDTWTVDIGLVSDTVNNIRVEIYRDGPGQYIMDADSVTIYVDHTAPDTAVLTEPQDNLDTHPGTITFGWEDTFDTFLSESVSVDTYQFQLSTVSSFATLWDIQILSDTSLSRTLAGDTTYYWRVITYDRAGDTTVSDSRSLFVYKPLSFDTAALTVTDGTDTLYYDNLNGDSALSHDSTHIVTISVENSDTVTLYYNLAGTLADTTDTTVSLTFMGDTVWQGTITADTTGDTVNFILEGIDSAGDTQVEDNNGAGFKYRVSFAVYEQSTGFHPVPREPLLGILPGEKNLPSISRQQHSLV